MPFLITNGCQCEHDIWKRMSIHFHSSGRQRNIFFFYSIFLFFVCWWKSSYSTARNTHKNMRQNARENWVNNFFSSLELPFTRARLPFLIYTKLSYICRVFCVERNRKKTLLNKFGDANGVWYWWESVRMTNSICAACFVRSVSLYFVDMHRYKAVWVCVLYSIRVFV